MKTKTLGVSSNPETFVGDIRDWNFNHGDADGVPVSDQGIYKLEINTDTSVGFSFSVVNKDYEGLACDQFGLFGYVEIRSGVPTISLGSTEGDNDIHIMSDNMGRISVISDVADEGWKPTWKPTEFSSANFVGLHYEAMADVDSEVIEIRQLKTANEIKTVFNVTVQSEDVAVNMENNTAIVTQDAAKYTAKFSNKSFVQILELAKETI
ncbi:hypothetical protein C9J27_24225 [Photobacterium kishitanii]|uniref:Uncharacterized protein n=2 Tax=Photobacterium kishitanii TaxID=318456 RepID=A0A2T3KAY7_9GAMM|nr:hypothetical protein C9J27_24225 [Photobacterium kishitanii]